ncbi:MAG: DUF1080 domain-containing protein [Planctomycetaceae bacterium]|nr:DUF1080 domain-containing protein [Planctomycetaceae bacterium]
MFFRRFVVMASLLVGTALASDGVALAADPVRPFLGDWAMTIPNGEAGWLSVSSPDGKTLSAEILWGSGSVVPTLDVGLENGTLMFTHDPLTGVPPKKGRPPVPVDLVTATVDGDQMNLTAIQKFPDGHLGAPATFSGKRLPPLPARPDLSKVRFGEPISLFNGKNLDGWRLIDPKACNGWSARDGVLVNDAAQKPGKPRIRYGNLRTDREFEDFNLTLETNVPRGGNSGVYLRGIYEVQVEDSYGRPLDSHNMGAIYSRIKPTETAEKPAGQWQTMDITLVDRHVTVVLNGKKIIDNQPLLGCTGGALWSDPFRPGPIYLQGDHTAIQYRNLVLRPVVK